MAALSSFLLGPCSSSPSASASSPAHGPSFFMAQVPFTPSPLLPLPIVPRLAVDRRRGHWAPARATAPTKPSLLSDERVQKVHNIEEFEAALRAAKNKLVVVEFAETKSDQSRQIYPAMVELSYMCGDVVFILVLGDESDATRALLKREGIENVPHFNFYKTMEKIHEEEGIGPDQLMGDVLYYGDNHSLVEQLHGREDVEALMAKTKEEGKMLVLDVGLKHCGPCVKVYPTVMKLSRSMKDVAVFARMNGDENESCMQFLRDMEVVEVPTFLFIKEGKISGRYVGSGKGELVGEILRYQGVGLT